MPKILKLEQHVADLIAAGEVVQRPASVVKELIENSIDSGAGIITIEITSGGMTFIRVTDNGSGIAPEDVETAFLRHATSKLRDAQGLDAIGTLGFRGEALAAIAAVSRIELQTHQPGAVEGVCLVLDAGEVAKRSPAGCPEGTTVIVRDLFFNTPARLKFMKSDRAESWQLHRLFCDVRSPALIYLSALSKTAKQSTIRRAIRELIPVFTACWEESLKPGSLMRKPQMT